MESHRLMQKIPLNDVNILLWEFDGAINQVDKLISLSDLSDWRNIFATLQGDGKAIFVPEGESKNDILLGTVYVDNFDILSATLQLLSANDAVSILVSPRISYAYGYEYLLDILTKIQANQALEQLVRDADKQEEIENMLIHCFNRRDLPSECSSVVKHLSAFIHGIIDVGTAKSIINENLSIVSINNLLNEKEGTSIPTVLDRMIKDITRIAESENTVKQNMYKGLDAIFGAEREFLRQDDSCILGKEIALRGLKPPFNKYICIDLAKKLLPQCQEAQKAILVDSDQSASSTFSGSFIHALRTNHSYLEDNVYIGEVLISAIPLDKLFSDLKDKENSQRLLVLIFTALLKQRRFDFYRYVNKIKPKFSYQDRFELLDIYTDYLKNATNLTPSCKKEFFKEFVGFLLRSSADNTLGEVLFITTLVEKLQQDQFNELLRLETGAYRHWAMPNKKEPQYGMTRTWVDILNIAKDNVAKKLDALIKLYDGKLHINLETHDAIQKLFGIEKDRLRCKLASFSLFKDLMHTHHLDDYLKLLSQKRIELNSQAQNRLHP